MATFITLLSLLAGAYAGKKGLDESKDVDLINNETNKIIKACNDFIEQAPLCLQASRREINKKLEEIGALKMRVLSMGLLPYLNILVEKFEDYEMLDEQSEDDIHISLSISSERDKISKLPLINIDRNKLVTFGKSSAMAALGAFGVSAISNSLSASTMLPSLTKFAFLDCLPFAVGVSYYINVQIQKREAVKNYQEALNFYNKTMAYCEEVKGMIEGLEQISTFTDDCFKLLRDISGRFDIASQDLTSLIMEYSFRDEKIKIIDLPSEKRTFLKRLRLLSEVVYASFDIPFYTIKGYGDEHSLKLLKENNAKSDKLADEINNA